MSEPLSEKQVEDMICRTVKQTLLSLGIDHKNPIDTQQDFATLRELRLLFEDPEMQKDLMHVRKWRMSMDNVKSRGLVYIIGLAGLGFVAAVWAGIDVKFFGGNGGTP